MRFLEIQDRPVKGMWYSRLGCDSHRRDACATFLHGARLLLTGLLLVAHCVLLRPASAETTVPSQQQPILLAQAKLPTLEDVVFIESRVDRASVYIGEAVNLTLTFGQLKFRGIRVQNYYKTRQIRLPDTEGFLAGKLVEEIQESIRDGHTYVLTTYQLPLYPTRPGKLFIGSWRWQGTARGYTASGARTVQLDKSTNPITITVAPLPPAPPDFTGAVGRFQLSVSMDSTNLVQGVPTHLYLEIKGVGNPQSLRAPTLPREDWYRLDDPIESRGTISLDGNPNVAKRYAYVLMPLQDGTFDLGPFSFTSFSPTEKDYVTVTAPTLLVHVAPSEKDERLVVVGGNNHGVQDGLQIMDDGRFPLATDGGRIHGRKSWGRVIVVLALLPVVVFLVGWALRCAMVLSASICENGYKKQEYPQAARAKDHKSWLWPCHFSFFSKQRVSVESRLRAAMPGAAPVDGLRHAILRELEDITQSRTTGMTATELEFALTQLGWGEVAKQLGESLRQCEVLRYGGEPPEHAAVERVIVQASAALDQAGAWGAKR